MVTQVAVRKAELVSIGQLAGCCAEVSSELLDERGQLLDGLIGFAFDVLGARYLDGRVLPAGDTPDQAQPRSVQRPHTLARIRP